MVGQCYKQSLGLFFLFIVALDVGKSHMMVKKTTMCSDLIYWKLHLRYVNVLLHRSFIIQLKPRKNVIYIYDSIYIVFA